MNREQVIRELNFKAVRSSGPGGQNVNKVSTKVALTFAPKNSLGLSEAEKVRILNKLHSKLTNEGILLLQCDESRSQHKNKELVVKRFFDMLTYALKVPKVRKKTKPTKSAIEKRLKSKKKVALKKATRGKSDLD